MSFLGPYYINTEVTDQHGLPREVAVSGDIHCYYSEYGFEVEDAEVQCLETGDMLTDLLDTSELEKAEQELCESAYEACYVGGSIKDESIWHHKARTGAYLVHSVSKLPGELRWMAIATRSGGGAKGDVLLDVGDLLYDDNWKNEDKDKCHKLISGRSETSLSGKKSLE